MNVMRMAVVRGRSRTPSSPATACASTSRPSSTSACSRRREAVSIAAATLGRRTMEPEQLHALLSGKFVSAMRSVASEMTMEEMHEKRGDYVARVKAAAAEALAQNGLELESVAIIDLDQTDLEYFNPSNRFDAEGLTQLMRGHRGRRKMRNDIEQDSMIKIRTRNLEAERQALEIERESETARLEQERDIEIRRALQRTEVARERALRETEAEQAQISAREDDREGAHRQRAGHRRGAHRLRARNPAAGDRAHPGGRSQGNCARAKKSKRRASPTSARSTPPASPPSARSAARNRAHPHGRGSRDRGPRIDREGAHPAGPRHHRRAHRQRGGDAPARDRAHPRRRRGRDRRARRRRKRRASRRPRPSTPNASLRRADPRASKSQQLRAIQEAEIEAQQAVEAARIARERTLPPSGSAPSTTTRKLEIERNQAIEDRRHRRARGHRGPRIAQEERVRALEITRNRTVEEADIASREAIEAARIAQEKKIAGHASAPSRRPAGWRSSAPRRSRRPN